MSISARYSRFDVSFHDPQITVKTTHAQVNRIERNAGVTKGRTWPLFAPDALIYVASMWYEVR